MKKKLIDGDFENRDSLETENEIIICGDPDEVAYHDCDAMGCTSISHVVYRFSKTIGKQLYITAKERNRLRDGLMMLSIGSCNCLTKTPEVEYHQDYCRYKKIDALLNHKEG